MKYDKWFKLAIYIICITVFVSAFAIPHYYQRVQWTKVYQKINTTYWGKLSYYGEIAELEEVRKLCLDCNIIVYPDQFSGNTYVINAKGDTIFKYIKRRNE